MEDSNLSHELYEVRMRHRRQRLERVIAALRARAAEIERRGRPVPAPLREAIRGFRGDLDTLERNSSKGVGGRR